MTNDYPDDERDRDDQPSDRNGDDRSRRDSSEPLDGGWLSTLRTALDRLDRAAESDRLHVDYDVSVHTGFEELTDRERDLLATRPSTGRPSGPDRTPSRSRRVAKQREHVSTRTYEDELLVAVELADVDPKDVTVGYADDFLVIGHEGRELERVRVPWTEPNTTARIHNDVLTVTVTPDNP